MAIRIQIRRDTAANWTSTNAVLYPGEIGIETDTKKFKFGPTVTSPTVATAWNSIASYANVVPSDLSGTLSDYIEVADLGNPDGPAKLDVDGNLLIPENSIIFLVLFMPSLECQSKSRILFLSIRFFINK